MDESSNLSAPTHSPAHNSSNEKIEDAPNTSTASNENAQENPPTQPTTSNGHVTDKPTTSESQISHAKKPPVKAPDSHPKPKNPTRSTPNFDGRKTSHPESSTSKVTQELLKEEGAIKWDRNAAQQLQEFMFQLSAQLLDHAKSASEHRESNIVEFEDVNESVESFGKFVAFQA
jgi:histone H3/H4